MPIVNRVLNVLILALAVAALGLGYRLFAKRAELRDRGNALAVGMASMVAELDTNSGEQDRLGRALTADRQGGGALGWRNVAKLDDLVGQAKQQALKVRVQRDQLAESLARLGADMNVPDQPTAASFQQLRTCDAELTRLAARYAQIKARDEVVIEQVVKLGERVKAPVSTAQLAKVAEPEAYAGELTNLATRVETLARRGERYGEALQSIAATMGRPELKDRIAEGEVGDVKLLEEETSKLKEREGQLAKVMADYESTRKELDREMAKTEEATSKIAELNLTIAQSERAAKDQATEIGRLEEKLRILLAGRTPIEPTQDIAGNVENVNHEWNFVILNVGETQGVKRGVAFTVSRAGEFICKVQVRKVFKSYAVADVLPELRRGQVLPGDRAFCYLQ